MLCCVATLRVAQLLCNKFPLVALYSFSFALSINHSNSYNAFFEFFFLVLVVVVVDCIIIFKSK